MKAGVRVLLVDDDEDLRYIVGMALQRRGYEVLSAPNGAVALDFVREATPSLILLDMRMPVMDGWAFAAAYRQTPGPHAPIVVLSAAVEAAAYAADIQADGCLAKPFTLQQLFALLDSYTAVSET